MRVIFVPVADRPECAKALGTAFDLGGRLSANIAGCHIRPHSYSEVTLREEFGSLVDYETAWEATGQDKHTAKSNVAAKALFSQIVEDHDYRIIAKPQAQAGAFWMEKVGSPDRVISNIGPVSDLLIVSRPASKTGKLARMFMMAALLNSSRPVLVLPQSGKKSIGRRISIAWNQSAEAAQAVSAALPLLQLADEVNIITTGPESGMGPKSVQLSTYLRFWGIKSRRIVSKHKDHSTAILKAYRESKSDLLVMGAYSRSRLRERIFGGVTQHMLHKANIPVLMLHT